MKEITVIGGGASGMAAAVEASAFHHVTLFEKNEKLGKKLYITGKGRCNLTNDCDPDTLIRNVKSNPKFLHSAFRSYSPGDVMEFLRAHGCPVKTERGNRVFPVSDHSSDVIKAFERALAEKKVSVRLNSEVRGIKQNGDRIEGVFVSENGASLRFYASDAVIVATGGSSYPLTGSTGDGYRFAEALGLNVTDRHPSLVPLETKESWPKALSGLTLKNVSLSVFDGGKEIFYEFGEMLFTHFGISGPIVLTASSELAGRFYKGECLAASIDLKPALSLETLSERIRREIDETPASSLQNVVKRLVPHALSPVIMETSGIDGSMRSSGLSKEGRVRLADALKKLPITLTGTRGFSEAVITRGGVDVKEIDPKT
ncbi:MAG: aminoacetone oxidase family FAD-binding enzyme, partial [Lachnospiraceae bacterium]|nr:aminoacetone oxidase family FAD-binding enzyme [Lachnospiraceae bacterium]